MALLNRLQFRCFWDSPRLGGCAVVAVLALTLFEDGRLHEATAAPSAATPVPNSSDARRVGTSADLELVRVAASAPTQQQLNWCDNVGRTYSNDQQIAGCTASINSGRESRQNLAVSYYNRGNAYFKKGDLDRAIADYNEAIRLNPKDFDNFTNRGLVYMHKGDFDRAIADYNEAIRLDPKSSIAYRRRGLVNLYSGSLPQAWDDLNQSRALNRKDAYAALWLDIANNRNKLPSQLAGATTQLDMTMWPAPIVRLYLGQLTVEAVFAAADDPSAYTRNSRFCEANFYIGELELRGGAKDKAAHFFQLAALDCPKDWDELFAAKAARDLLLVDWPR
jgi:lipoprotein NlpI